MDRREQNIRVFFDTESWCRSTEKLRRSIRRSREGTRLILPDQEVTVPVSGKDREMQIEVTQERSFQAAIRLSQVQPSIRLGVLNFASAVTPGGGVRSGSSAQEESLCRCSTLYPVLTAEELSEGFYQMHRRKRDQLYTDACIYSPDIVICKTDTANPERLDPEDWVMTDVITCAAPNLREPRPVPGRRTSQPVQLGKEELFRVHRKRAVRILSVAAQAGIEAFVTGAFGCGAFQNDPVLVAGAWKEALEELPGIFRRIVFAVYTSPRDKANYEAFYDTFGCHGDGPFGNFF